MNFDFYKVQFWSKAQKIQKQIVWSGKSVVVHVLSPWFMLIFFIDGFYIWFSTIVCGLYSDFKQMKTNRNGMHIEMIENYYGTY